MSGRFEGDVSPQEAWLALVQDGSAVLLDVRTPAEWDQVGIPDLSSLGRPLIQVDWQRFPPADRRRKFVAEVAARGITPSQPVFVICRSGVRSKAAGEALAGTGFVTFNVADGFEGKPVFPGSPVTSGGWKGAGLPWKKPQQSTPQRSTPLMSRELAMA